MDRKRIRFVMIPHRRMFVPRGRDPISRLSTSLAFCTTLFFCPSFFCLGSWLRQCEMNLLEKTCACSTQIQLAKPLMTSRFPTDTTSSLPRPDSALCHCRWSLAEGIFFFVRIVASPGGESK